MAGLYALINAASHCVCGELQWQTWQHCQKQFDVNFLGVVQTVRTFLPLLKSAKGNDATFEAVDSLRVVVNKLKAMPTDWKTTLAHQVGS